MARVGVHETCKCLVCEAPWGPCHLKLSLLLGHDTDCDNARCILVGAVEVFALGVNYHTYRSLLRSVDHQVTSTRPVLLRRLLK